jgi:C-terminal processing protease CtpA/Prc
MRYIYLFALLLVASCTQNRYSSIDHPSTISPNSQLDRDIIAYIDQRLEEEYYWLDEVNERGYMFERDTKKWSEYLPSALSMLRTNGDDGYIKSNGQRAFYSYIREYEPTTRATTLGFGIMLHYTILSSGSQDNTYYFVVDHVYPSSPAAEAGIERGDLITMVNDGYITSNNYSTLFNSIQANTKQSVTLALYRQTTKESREVELTKGQYDKSPVAHSEVIEVANMKIGYLVYTGFEGEYDEVLLDALREFAADGVQEVILDLRVNGGGSVNSAVKLCSALMPQSLEGGTLCTLVRNPNNKRMAESSTFTLAETGAILSLDDLTVICSGYSASASELVIMGLRGLDVPVKLIGSQTEGKNCGMDVTRKSIGSKSLEFAPITFMCFNAKGVGDWGEGIIPDIDLSSESNSLGVYDANYPMPRTAWGDMHYDIALAAALSHVTGKPLSQATRSETHFESFDSRYIDCPIEGIRVLVEE